jgi:MoaA/NifB/PqqE/SkfB family radical SAM enzyme
MNAQTLPFLRNQIRHVAKIASIVLHPVVPPDLIFFITSRCNATCGFCLFHDQVHDRERKKGELALDEIEEIAKHYGSLTKLSLSGGEPFLRHDIAKIIRAFDTHARPAIFDIPTNGFYVERIGRHVREMLEYTEEHQPVIELQLSIDGPREIHDAVRGVPGIFDKILETYWVLDEIRQQNSRLRIKMNLTYVAENEDAVIQLTDEFDKKYKFDRFQITFPHGPKVEANTIRKLSYHKYVEQSREILKHAVSNRREDLHSLVFRAVKMIKDDILLDVMQHGDMGAKCHAGRRILVIDEQGKVYPCEPLWESIGDLRETDYRIMPILTGAEYKAFAERRLGSGKCNCTWGNVLLDSIVFNPAYFPRILRNMVDLRASGGQGIRQSHSPLVREALEKGVTPATEVPDAASVKARAEAATRAARRRLPLLNDPVVPHEAQA